jgi:folate-binding protein YgfZ
MMALMISTPTDDTSAFFFTPLRGRKIVRVGGKDPRAFLQKLITQDLTSLTPQNPLYAALLGPDGRYVSDFFVIEPPDGIEGGIEGGISEGISEVVYLDLSETHIPHIIQHLRRYAFRSAITIDLLDDMDVWAWGPILLDHWGDTGTENATGSGLVQVKSSILNTPIFNTPIPNAPTLNSPTPSPPFLTLLDQRRVAYQDPRLPTLGWRVMMPNGKLSNGESKCFETFKNGMSAHYTTLRLANGISEPPEDLWQAKSIILEHGFHELGAVSWTKGCYIGQELMARTFHRGQLHKRALPVRIEGDAPPLGTVVSHHDEIIGEMLSSQGDRGMILARLAPLKTCLHTSPSLRVGKSLLTPYKPSWMTLGF